MCIDNMPITAELKLLRLRQCLSGTPLKSIKVYGYLAAAYQAALHLEQKYGGQGDLPLARDRFSARLLSASITARKV